MGLEIFPGTREQIEDIRRQFIGFNHFTHRLWSVDGC